MFLIELSSSDLRFKTLSFHEGLNILVADRTEQSVQGDSRNSIGKTSAVKILRYVLGGNLPEEYSIPELAEHSFSATLRLSGLDGVSRNTVVATRPVSPQTRIHVSGWDQTFGESNLTIDEWRILLSRHVFHIPEEVNRPTAGQIWSQLIRTYFENPIKGHASETDWESGVRIGFLLGLSPEILGKAGGIHRLSSQQRALKRAIKEGAITYISLDEPALRAQLATARRLRDRTHGSIKSFRVDGQYSAHQQKADEHSAEIQRLNDEGLSLQRRSREIRAAITDEIPTPEQGKQSSRLAQIYAEMGVLLPAAVKRRYDEVSKFHESIIRNRRLFLEQELGIVEARLEAIEAMRQGLDSQRSQVLQLLSETVALDTFLTMQRELAELDATVADLERRIETAHSISTINDTIKLREAELTASVRAEIAERESQLDEAISLFGDLGSEIYSDRDSSLLISPSSKGILKVEPYISGDGSTGVRNVKTFMLDMVCAILAMEGSRAPSLLVHDSHLFDAIDGRQVASCLAIGSRLAKQYGFQYLVTFNSDFLETVQIQGDGGFDPTHHILGTRLTDKTESGGLFGFRFG